MDFSSLILTTLQSLIGLGVSVLIPVIVKGLLSKISRENLSKYASMASIAVLAVEQTMGSASAIEKKKAAEQRLSQMAKGAISGEQIDHLLESSVFMMKQEFDLAIAPVEPVPLTHDYSLDPVSLFVPITVPVEAPVETPVG